MVLLLPNPSRSLETTEIPILPAFSLQDLSISEAETPLGIVDISKYGESIELSKFMAESLGVLLDDHHFMETVTMSAFLWPYASIQRLSLMMLFNAVGFGFDDLMGHDKLANGNQLNKGAFLAKLDRSIVDFNYMIELEKDPTREGELALAAAKFFVKIKALSNQDFANRFIRNTVRHWQVSFSIEDEMPNSIEDFIAIRRETGGMYPTIDLIEFASNSYLTEEMRELPGFAEAHLCLNDIGGLSNELMSYNKEVMDQKAKLNFVPVVEFHKKLSTSSAISEIIDFINHRHEEFKININLVEELGRESLGDEEFQTLQTIIAGMKHFVWAAYHWQITTERYKHPQHIFPELRSNERLYQEV